MLQGLEGRVFVTPLVAYQRLLEGTYGADYNGGAMIDNEDIDLNPRHTKKCEYCTGDMIDIQKNVSIYDMDGYCTLDVEYATDRGGYNTIEISIKYCPMCGRKL